PAPTTMASYDLCATGSGGPSGPERTEHLERGDPARRSHDPASGMHRRPAHPQVPQRRPVPRPARNRPVEEQLLQRQLALEDVALRQTEALLDVLRREDLLVE